MSRALKFLPLIILCAAVPCLLLAALCIVLNLAPDSAAEAAALAGPVRLPSAAQQPAPDTTPTLGAPLRPPSKWSLPPLQSVIADLRRTPLVSRAPVSRLIDVPPKVLTGSYAILTANDMGDPSPQRPLEGLLSAVSLTYTYPRRFQQQQNIALVNTHDVLGSEGTFVLTLSSPGRYAICFHLENPSPQPYELTTRLRRTLPAPSSDVINDTRTVASGQSLTVAGILDSPVAGNTALEWQATTQASGPGPYHPIVLFRALTVDKL